MMLHSIQDTSLPRWEAVGPHPHHVGKLSMPAGLEEADDGTFADT